MRFLADENVPSASVSRLREAGHDVAAVAEDALGSGDSEVLGWAASEERIVLTFDRDYGELVYSSGLPTPAGVVYFRLMSPTPEAPAERLLGLLEVQGFPARGMFTVVERERVRQRPLPQTGQ